MMNTVVLMQPSDASLVAESLAGNREAFGQIVTRYQSLICSLAYSGTGSLTQSEDLAQETFIAAWKQLGSLREPHKLRSWLCRIARNRIYDALKAQGREPSHAAEPLDTIHESQTSEPQPRDLAISHEEAAILWSSLERIPEIYREPLILFYREQQTILAVAEKLGLTEDNAKQRLSRGRKLLQGEVLALVEGALARTVPGHAFTLGVLAALPVMTISAKAATLGAAAKGGAAAKSAGLLGLFGAILTPLLLLVGMWVDYRLRKKRGLPAGLLKRMKVYYTTIAVSVLAFVLVVGILMDHGGALVKRSPVLFPVLMSSLVLGYPIAILLLARNFFRRFNALSTEQAPDVVSKYDLPAYEYRSRFEFLGLPLIHIRWGGRLGETSWKFAKGWIAVGNCAFGGLFAYGGLAIAPISIGPCAVGLLSYGAMAIGAATLGGFSFGIWAFGAFAFGWQAFSGGCAIAWNLAWGAQYAIAHQYALGSGVVHAAQANTPFVEQLLKSTWGHRVCEIISPYFFWLIWVWSIPMLLTTIANWRAIVRKPRPAKMFATILAGAFALQVSSANVESLPDRITVTVRGKGPDVLLIPGLACSSAVWDATAKRFERQYRFHIVQVAGFGGAPTAANASEALLEPTVAALDVYIKTNKLKSPKVIGHSMGGLMGMMLVVQNPEDVGKLMVVDSLPFFSVLMGAKDAAGARSQAEFMRGMIQSQTQDAYAQSERQMLRTLVKSPEGRKLATTWAIASDKSVVARAMFEVMTTDLRPRLHEMKIPVTVLYPWDASSGFAQAATDNLYRQNFSNLPNKTLVRVDESFHFIMLDQPEKFATQVEAFLK